jgi:hypothetical protein
VVKKYPSVNHVCLKRADDPMRICTHFPCMGSQIQTTPCPDFWTAEMCPAR